LTTNLLIATLVGCVCVCRGCNKRFNVFATFKRFERLKKLFERFLHLWCVSCV